LEFAFCVNTWFIYETYTNATPDATMFYEMLERIMVLQIMKTMAHSKAEEQREMLDVILDGGDRVVKTIANIRAIEQQKGHVIDTKPLARYEPAFYIEQNERIFNMEKPTPPRPIIPPKTNEQSAMQSIYSEILLIRKKIQSYENAGLCGAAELNELDGDIYSVLIKIYNSINKV
jgi:hypothetical protein